MRSGALPRFSSKIPGFILFLILTAASSQLFFLEVAAVLAWTHWIDGAAEVGRSRVVPTEDVADHQPQSLDVMLVGRAGGAGGRTVTDGFHGLLEPRLTFGLRFPQTPQRNQRRR